MASATYRPNRRFAAAVLRSASVQGKVEECAARVKQAADGYGTASYAVRGRVGSERARAFVYTPSTHAINSNAKHKSLIKAIRAFRRG